MDCNEINKPVPNLKRITPEECQEIKDKIKRYTYDTATEEVNVVLEFDLCDESDFEKYRHYSNVVIEKEYKRTLLDELLDR